MEESPFRQIGTLKARFVRKADGNPVSGTSGQYSVRVFDKDMLSDDKLGEPRLDANGCVECTFDLNNAVSLDSPGETKPDVYLVLYEREKEIFRTGVSWDVDFDQREATSGITKPVVHDLGTFTV